ncbi:DUF481 domain-containing protein [Sphingomonas cavernae]|nr:DUF481 domain-containing protein [Sphingomonas cavernae]
MPDSARTMLDAAIAGGDEAEIMTIAKYAEMTWPDAAAEIRVRIGVWRTDRKIAARPDEARVEPNESAEKLAEKTASPAVPWKGKGELGGYYATGNSEYFGVSTGVKLTRDDPVWRHAFIAQADYQENDGQATRERYLVSYAPNYRFSPQTYVYGLGQYEHDRFLGYDSRYAISAGIGYRTPNGKPLSVELEAGPAYRFTEFVDGGAESSAAGRGSISVEWKIAPSLTFNQDAAIYVDSLNSTINGTSALNAKVYGPLSARLSYNVQYESAPPQGRQTTDRLSRVSLVYDF